MTEKKHYICELDVATMLIINTMGVKKQFSAPAVLQTVPIELEEDLLIGPSGDLQILAGGHDYEEWNMDSGSYSSSDWSTLSD